MKIDFEGVLKPWGDDPGIQVPAELARQHGLSEGAHVRIHIEAAAPRNDPDALPDWDFGGTYGIGEILDEEID